jgi:hypothetical protein
MTARLATMDGQFAVMWAAWEEFVICLPVRDRS